MRDYRDHDPDELYSFSRPSVSAWVAGIAVACLVFVTGGLIKTYRQMEDLREESRREVQELHQIIKKLQGQGGERPVATRQIAPRSPRQQELRPPEAVAPRRETVGTRPVSGLPALPANLDSSSEEPSGQKVIVGRKSPVDPNANRPPMRVISVAYEQNRIIINGGRNVELEKGNRFDLFRNGEYICDLRVETVYNDQAVCEVLMSRSNLKPEPGDVVRYPAQGFPLSDQNN